jgi:arylsulfatase A-like enzyme
MAFTDDQGYTDVGYHGIDGQVITPHIDKLANGGMIFTNGYVTAPQCSPSRAALMTGRHQASFGLFQNDHLGETELITPDVKIVAERLQDVGYVTGVAGKTQPLPVPGSNGTLSLRGFDHFWHFLDEMIITNSNHTAEGAFKRRNFRGIVRNPSQAAKFKDEETQEWKGLYRYRPPRENRVDVLSAIAADFLEDFATNQPSSKRFFFYFAPYAPHVPVLTDDDKHVQLFKKPFAGSKTLHKEENDYRMRGLAMVRAIDVAVGDIMSTLRKHSMEENTLFLYASDNGAPLKGHWDPSHFQRFVPNGFFGLASYNGGENMPLRGEKSMLWEGGIRVPMFAYWKGKIAAGQSVHAPTSTLDLAATIADAAGIELTSSDFHGESLLPLFTQPARSSVAAVSAAADDGHGVTALDINDLRDAKALYWYFPQGCFHYAIRVKTWKLLVKDQQTMYLFDVAGDREELEEVSALHSEVTDILKQRLFDWLGTLPNYDPVPLDAENTSKTSGFMFGCKLDPYHDALPVDALAQKGRCIADPRYIHRGTSLCYPARISFHLVNETSPFAKSIR